MPQFTELPIRTERLSLRPPCVDDADALFELFSDAEGMRYWASAPWTSREQALEQIARDQAACAAGSALRLALQPVQSGTVIGTVSLFAFHEQCARAEIGYILRRGLWGQGLMHEALTAVVHYATSTLKLRRIEADIDPRNLRSIRSVERLGFVREGLLRERWIVAGEICDTVMYGLLARDWAARP
ncbi:MAG: GNAT family protein [Nannocystaceae bacterium]